MLLGGPFGDPDLCSVLEDIDLNLHSWGFSQGALIGVIPPNTIGSHLKMGFFD